MWANPLSGLVATRKTSGRKHYTDVNGYGRQANTLPHHGQRRSEGYRPGDLASARASSGRSTLPPARSHATGQPRPRISALQGRRLRARLLLAFTRLHQIDSSEIAPRILARKIQCQPCAGRTQRYAPARTGQPSPDGVGVRPEGKDFGTSPKCRDIREIVASLLPNTGRNTRNMSSRDFAFEAAGTMRIVCLGWGSFDLGSSRSGYYPGAA